MAVSESFLSKYHAWGVGQLEGMGRQKDQCTCLNLMHKIPSLNSRFVWFNMKICSLIIF